MKCSFFRDFFSLLLGIPFLSELNFNVYDVCVISLRCGERDVWFSCVFCALRSASWSGLYVEFCGCGLIFSFCELGSFCGECGFLLVIFYEHGVCGFFASFSPLRHLDAPAFSWPILKDQDCGFCSKPEDLLILLRL